MNFLSVISKKEKYVLYNREIVLKKKHTNCSRFIKDMHSHLRNSRFTALFYVTLDKKHRRIQRRNLCFTRREEQYFAPRFIEVKLGIGSICRAYIDRAKYRS